VVLITKHVWKEKKITKLISMKTKDPVIEELLQKKIIFLFPISIFISFLTTKYTPEKFVDGLQFVYSFLSILPMVFINLYLLNFFLQKLLSNPNKLNNSLKYVAYTMILIFGLAPFLYLWGMWDVILNLKW
jgi:hypothetical protein